MSISQSFSKAFDQVVCEVAKAMGVAPPNLNVRVVQATQNVVQQAVLDLIKKDKSVRKAIQDLINQ